MFAVHSNGNCIQHWLRWTANGQKAIVTTLMLPLLQQDELEISALATQCSRFRPASIRVISLSEQTVRLASNKKAPAYVFHSCNNSSCRIADGHRYHYHNHPSTSTSITVLQMLLSIIAVWFLLRLFWPLSLLTQSVLSSIRNHTQSEEYKSDCTGRDKLLRKRNG